MIHKPVLLILFLATTLFVQTSFAQSRLSIGDQHSFYSDILEQDRRIFVGLPRDYTEDKKYPVLYLLDGGEYYQIAQGVLDYLHHRAVKIPQVILVALPNVDRNTDLTPVYEPHDPNARTIEYSGGAENFLKFIKHELRPFITDRYSTSGNNILFGHSLAGLFAAYTFLEEPRLFDNYIISDPSLWYGENMLIKKLSVNKLSYFGIEKSVVMTSINRTQDEEDIMSQPQAAFMKLLESLPNMTTTKKLIEGETHSTVPLKSLYQGLPFIFKDYVSEQ